MSPEDQVAATLDFLRRFRKQCHLAVKDRYLPALDETICLVEKFRDFAQKNGWKITENVLKDP